MLTGTLLITSARISATLGLRKTKPTRIKRQLDRRRIRQTRKSRLSRLRLIPKPASPRPQRCRFPVVRPADGFGTTPIRTRVGVDGIRPVGRGLILRAGVGTQPGTGT